MSHARTTETDITAELGAIAWEYLNENDKRVANALHELLQALEAALNAAPDRQSREAALRAFRKQSRWAPADLVDELLIACLNSGQYERGLDVCDAAVRMGICNEGDLIDDRPELLVRCGRAEEAERLLLDALDHAPDDPWSYIRLGDCSYEYVIQDEHRDLERAEDWYYRGYDRGLADQKTEDGQALLERLRDVCIDRLRHDAERRLLQTLEMFEIGGRETLMQLREQVRIAGDRSVLLAHLTDAIGRASAATSRASLDRVSTDLQHLIDAYNLMLQERLDGRSPFEVRALEPKGPHEVRMFQEMVQAFEMFRQSHQDVPSGGARWSELFSEFQGAFFAQVDPVTGKRCSAVIDRERRETKRRAARGELPWMGFLEYRRT